MRYCWADLFSLVYLIFFWLAVTLCNICFWWFPEAYSSIMNVQLYFSVQACCCPCWACVVAWGCCWCANRSVMIVAERLPTKWTECRVVYGTKRSEMKEVAWKQLRVVSSIDNRTMKGLWHNDDAMKYWSWYQKIRNTYKKTFWWYIKKEAGITTSFSNNFNENYKAITNS